MKKSFQIKITSNESISKSKPLKIDLPPLTYTLQAPYKIKFPDKIESASLNASKYHWKESDAKTIRNSDIAQILSGSLVLNGRKTGAVKQEIQANMELPKIIYAKKYDSKLPGIVHVEPSTIPDTLDQREFCLPRTPKPSKSDLIPKRHRHKQRHLSKHCKHKPPKPEPASIDSIEKLNDEDEEHNSTDTDIAWTYSTVNLNKELVEEGSESGKNIEPVVDINVGSVGPTDQKLGNSAINTIIIQEEQSRAHTAATNLSFSSAIVTESSKNLTEEAPTASLNTSSTNLEVKSPKSTEKGRTKALTAKIQGHFLGLSKGPTYPKDIPTWMFRWKYAIESSFRSIRLRRIPNISTKVFDFSQFLGDDEMNLLKKIHVEKLEKALHILKQTPDMKQKHMDVMILKLEEAMRKTFPWFAKLKGAVRSEIAGVARVEIHPRGRRVIREGTPTTTVYLLASGLCVEHKLSSEDGEKKDQVIGLIRAGECIGETLGNAIPKRITSVTTITRSVFVCIERVDWLRAMRRGGDEASKIEGLASLPLFSSLNSKQIETLCSVSTETAAVTGTIVHEPFHEPSNLYFIVKGKCSLTLHIPFVKTVKDSVKHLISPSEYQVVPYHGQPIKPEKDELVHATYPLAELKVGDCFPPIFYRDIRGTFKSYTVTAMEAIECLVFNLPTVHEKFPQNVLNGIKEQQDSIYSNDMQARELQEHYLSTKGWRNDHESLMAQMLSNEIEKERQERIQARFGRRRKI